MSLGEMLERSKKEYDEYQREQARLSRTGEADPEFIAMLETSRTAEEKWVEVNFPFLGLERGEVAVPVRSKPSKKSAVEEDALLFERGADWLDTRGNKWVKGSWVETVHLPSGKTADGRCALGAIFAAHDWPASGNPEKQQMFPLEKALRRVGLTVNHVIEWNDNSNDGYGEDFVPVNKKQVSRFLRGVAWMIREGVSYNS